MESSTNGVKPANDGTKGIELISQMNIKLKETTTTTTGTTTEMVIIPHLHLQTGMQQANQVDIYLCLATIMQ